MSSRGRNKTDSSRKVVPLKGRTGRELAGLVLDRIVRDQAYAGLALNEIFREFPDSDQREKAFATELVYGTLRHLITIDYILGRLLSRPLASLKIPVASQLRLAIFQLEYLPDIPERAVCHSAVENVKHSAFSGLAPLTNGVLRNFIRTRNQIRFPQPTENLEEYLSIRYSHPRWLISRWIRQFGPNQAEELLRLDNQSPPLTLRVNRLRAVPAAIRDGLNERGIHCHAGLWLDEAVELNENAGAISELPEFLSGQVFVQDESPMLVAHLLNPRPGERIIDLCAAPGGKSTHLAELMEDKGEIISIDDHPHKVKLIASNAERLGLDCIKPQLGDAREFTLYEGNLVDAVLLDAPCSGTGVLRRKPDARYRRREADIAALSRTQQALLDHAATLVRPGGRLVYSTCSLETEENEGQIKSFLANHPHFIPVEYQPFLPEKLRESLFDPEAKWATVFPTAGGGDGFFLCRMERSRE